jgi:hypothetical protein
MGQVERIFSVFAWSDLTSVHGEHVVPMMMIGLFGVLVIFALVAHRLVIRETRRRSIPEPPEEAMGGISASLFEAPTRWLAIRTQNTRAVQLALEVQHVRLCAWSDALVTPFEPRLFISPPVRGWTIVMGCDLPDPAEDIDQCFVFLSHLSQKLGEVQFFVRNRAVSYHGWARLDGGKVQRAYVWAGETLWHQGGVTEAERDLRVRCLPYMESAEVLGLNERELLGANTEKVLRLAGAWSLDPTSVEATALEAKGIAGDLLHSKFH